MTYRDTPEKVFKQLIDQYKDKYQISIGFNQEVTKEETDVEKAVRQLATDNNVQIKEYWTSTLYHPDDLPFNNPKAYAVRSAILDLILCLIDFPMFSHTFVWH